jgi:hypothetical protein
MLISPRKLFQELLAINADLADQNDPDMRDEFRLSEKQLHVMRSKLANLEAFVKENRLQKPFKRHNNLHDKLMQQILDPSKKGLSKKEEEEYKELEKFMRTRINIPLR